MSLRSGQWLVVVPDDDPPIMVDSAAMVRLKSTPGVRVTVHGSRPVSERDLQQRLTGAHTAVFTHSAAQLTHHTVAGLGLLKHIVLTGGVGDSGSLDWAAGAGIHVTSTPDTISGAVAEHALALMLSLARKIPELDQRVRAGEWPRGLITQLAGKRLGIVGTGIAGKKLAILAEGIGMRVISWPADSGTPAEPRDFGGNLDLLLRNADVVSLHVQQAEAAGRMIGVRQFALMKPSALFVNTERAGLVDESALAQALTSKTIAGAALDVFAREPLPKDSPLMNLPNVILSPHTGGATAEALEADLHEAAEQVISFIAHGGGSDLQTTG